MPPLNPAKPGQVLSAFHVGSLEQFPETLKLVCLLPVLRAGQAFCVRSHSAYKGLPSPSVGAHGGQPWGRRGWGTWSIRIAPGPAGGSTGEVPQTAHWWSSWRSPWHFHSPLMSSESWLLCSQPLPISQLCPSPQFSWWGEKEVGILGCVLHTWGGQVLTHFPPWEELGSEGVSLIIELCCLGRGVMHVKWNYSYPLQLSFLVCFFFLQ